MRDQSPQPSEFAFPVRLQPLEDDFALATSARIPWGWLEGFVLLQVFWAVLLFIPGSQAYRAYIRGFPYVMSLLAFIACSRATGAHGAVPGARWMLAALAILVANLVRPETWLMSGIAQVAFQFAIAAPLFWAARFDLTDARLERLIRLIFVANFASGLLGLLQVYFPERFLPPEFSALAIQMNPNIVTELSYIGADYRLIVRPPGLSDLPGGASIAATVAALLGFTLAMGRHRGQLWRAIYLGCAFVCITVVYLTHVRSMLLSILGCMLVMALLRLRQGRIVQGTSIAVVAGALILGAFVWAVSVGGEAVSTRFFDIAETGVMQTFQQNRGQFLSYTIEEGLAEYPFGAGLGRWGMMSVYFGEPNNWLYPPLHAEIQLTGWLFDGGVFLWLAYGGAILVAMRYSYLLAISGAGLLSDCATMVFCIQLFIVTLCFAGPAFNTQLGIVFWLLSATLFGCHRTLVMNELHDEVEGAEDEVPA